MKAYVVGRAGRDPFTPPEFLRLEGPFAYPRWVLDASKATPLPGTLAAQWAEAVRGPRDEVLVLPIEAHPQIPRAEDKAPDTRREPRLEEDDFRPRMFAPPRGIPGEE